ncbi:TrbG/VirB9 family P-type conjugative transfer protein [Mesoterricola sediminis]|uniref:Uncharacterized protein n=1 Tax=Mesoterricola sediminis TaxID=2927980 RepID=A0AA48GV60_9BACT|nr:TrbG/VirB9 family P-type conjugative transfer protein [Mesoterricola sediminis]BDU76844.1 hypothetical protein METESE_18020 [Mesoterricola sediminis]
MRPAFAIVLLCAALSAQDTQKVPYLPSRVYSLRLIPGAPAMVELPQGETVRNIWYDKSFFKAESTPETNRVVVQATNTPEAIGKISYIHIETEPSNLQVSLKVEGVPERHESPSVLQIYMDGSDEGSLVNAQVQQRVKRETLYARKFAEDKAAADFQAWRRDLLQNLNDNYAWGGDMQIDRVVDDKVQTYVYMPGASDKAVIELLDRAGKPDKVNYELENGSYVVAKVLRPGEKLHLILGKEQACIRLK